MDWRRAKSIILVVLILLNIFLFINVLNVKDPFNISGQYQKDAKKALETAGVIVAGRIPSYKPLGRISYTEEDAAVYTEMIRRLIGLEDENTATFTKNTWELDGRTLRFQEDVFIYTVEANRESLPVEKERELDRKLRAWIRDNGISSETYVQDGMEKNGDTVTVEYIRQYKNAPLFSQRITFTIEDTKLIKVEGNLKVLKAIKLSKATDEIISANIVLLTGKDKVSGIVQSIDLGYLSLQKDDLYDTPVWRITLSTGKKAWFNAYTGEYVEYE